MDTNTLAGLQTAFARCCQVGHDTNKEHFCLLGLEGQLLAEKTGEEDHVDLVGFFNEQSKYGVHNHNKPYPISLPDIMCATVSQNVMYVVTLNGDKYWSSGIDLDLSNFIGSLHALALEEKAIAMQESGIRQLQQTYPGMTEDTATQITVHFFNLALQKSYYRLDYHFELTPETEALYRKLEPLFRG